jgi:hypothetical protein
MGVCLASRRCGIHMQVRGDERAHTIRRIFRHEHSFEEKKTRDFSLAYELRDRIIGVQVIAL